MAIHPIDPNVNTNEQNKFGEKTTGQVAVHVISENEGGSITPAGLDEDMRITTMDVTDTATLLPAVPLTNRNAMVVINHSATDILYVSKNPLLTADLVNGTTSGYQIQAGFEWNIDITDDIALYARAETGKTLKVQIVEIA